MFENFKDEPFYIQLLKYKKGDFVKYNGARNHHIFIIDDADVIDDFKPYLIKVVNDNSGQIIPGDHWWVKETDLYTDKETELYSASNKYNL